MTTHDLQDLLDSASERVTAFTPDPVALAAAGRRRARKHRALVSGAVVLTTASVLVAAGLFGATLKEASPPTAGVPTPEPAPAHTDLCSEAGNYAATARNHPWTSQVATYWTTKVLEVRDQDGSMTVRQSPDGKRYAYCVAGVPIDDTPTGGHGSTIVNEGIITAETQIVQYWAFGCRTASPRTYRNANGSNYGTVDTCLGLRYSWAGKLPPGVTRVRLNGLGQDTDAQQADGFWVGRVYTPDRGRGNNDPITITMHNAAGEQVFSHRYN